MIFSRLFQLLVAIWKTLIGAMLCQSPLTAVAVVGWTNRFMRRRILRSWWKKSPQAAQAEASFDSYVNSYALPCPGQTWPNWFKAEGNGSLAPNAKSWPRYFGSMTSNLRQGLVGVLLILLFTLPATSLWLYSWVLGWNISFFKLYEQSDLGALIGLSGILLFCLVMLYVPLAHARQAFSGDWREFFQIRRNWRLIRRHPATMLPAVMAFVLATGGVMLLRVAPYFLGSTETVADMSVEQLQAWLSNYHLFAGVILFPAYVLVWAAVAGAYARAVASEYAQNRSSESLNEIEQRTLSQLQIPSYEVSEAHPLVRSAKFSMAKLATVGALSLSGLAWFAVAGQVFVAQFLNYLPGIHWLNHPLVLLPWIKYVPPL